MWRVLQRMERGEAEKSEIDLLFDVTTQVEGHTICALGDARGLAGAGADPPLPAGTMIEDAHATGRYSGRRSARRSCGVRRCAIGDLATARAMSGGNARTRHAGSVALAFVAKPGRACGASGRRDAEQLIIDGRPESRTASR